MDIHSSQSSEIEFAVQVAAAKYRLSNIKLSEIYSGNYPVRMVVEDGWYKYQIEAGRSYSNAQQIKSECGVNDAFIIVYNRSVKDKLTQAIKTSR